MRDIDFDRNRELHRPYDNGYSQPHSAIGVRLPIQSAANFCLNRSRCERLAFSTTFDHANYRGGERSIAIAEQVHGIEVMSPPLFNDADIEAIGFQH